MILLNDFMRCSSKMDTDENVRKFIEAMGTWEWTLKKWQTLDDWANWWRNLGGYSSQWGSELWENKDYTWDYDPSLSGYFENWFKLSKDDRANTLKEYWITQKEFNNQYNAYFEDKEQTEAVESITKLRDTAQELLDWNKKNHWLHEWWADLETFKNWSYKSWRWVFQWQTKASEWAILYNFLKNNQSLDKFLEAKKNWGTFGSMSNAEWQLIWWAASKLNWETSDENFEAMLEEMIKDYDQALDKLNKWDNENTVFKWSFDLSKYGRTGK